MISEINSRAHRVIKEGNDAKFASLLTEVTSKSSTSSCDASLGNRTVVKIPEDLLLNNAEHSVLSKGLTFVPTVNETDEYQVKADCEKFLRRLRLKAHFHDSEDEHHEGENYHDPFTITLIAAVSLLLQRTTRSDQISPTSHRTKKLHYKT